MNSFFAGKNVLVTGGAGVIGRVLVKLLRSNKANVRVVDLAERPEEFDKSVHYYRCDLSQSEQFLFRFDPEYVFHLAADFERSDETEEFWESNYRNNILASHNLIREVKEKKSMKKIVFASSYLIYDKKLYNNTEKQNLLRESAKIDPRNLTGLAKLQTEMDLDFLSKIGSNRFDQVSARIFRVYGRGSRDIISRWIRSLIANEEISVFDQDNKFDYIFADDVAKALLLLCTNEATGIYNLGFGKSYAIADVIRFLRKEFEEIKVKETTNSICKESSTASIDKLEKALGWRPGINLEEGIREIIKYEKSRANEYSDNKCLE